MLNKVVYDNLISIIESAPGFTLGERDGILSKDDLYVNDFKLKVIPFCSKNYIKSAAIGEIVNTANYDNMKKVIANLKYGTISDLDATRCNEFANEFVKEVNGKIKNKKWYKQIVIMQCAIIDAIHTIFKECDELLTCVDSEIILELATEFSNWFKTLKISDTNDNKIAGAVNSFIQRLRLGKGAKLENESNIPESKISATQKGATEGRSEHPVIEKAKMTSLEQHAEYIDQPKSNDGNVAIPEENNQQFEKFLKSFEKNYWDTNCSWVDACTKELGSADDIKTLKAQLTNLIKASTRNDWIAASSAMIIGPLSKTLEKIFGANDDSNDAVKSRVNDVIKKQQQQQLLQNFLDAMEKSCLPFDANAWLDNLNSSTSFNQNLKQPLRDFMRCVTGEIDDANINKKTDELSDALCQAFAVSNTGSITTRLNEIVQRVKDMQKSLKEKYGTDIVDNLLKVIDFVAAQGYVDLS